MYVHRATLERARVAEPVTFGAESRASHNPGRWRLTRFWPSAARSLNRWRAGLVDSKALEKVVMIAVEAGKGQRAFEGEAQKKFEWILCLALQACAELVEGK